LVKVGLNRFALLVVHFLDALHLNCRRNQLPSFILNNLRTSEHIKNVERIIEHFIMGLLYFTEGLATANGKRVEWCMIVPFG